jgi:hypothetical protein
VTRRSFLFVLLSFTVGLLIGILVGRDRGKQEGGFFPAIEEDGA